MKALIITNWVLSFMALSIDTEASSFIAVMIVLGWFLASSLILIRAQKRGVFNQIEKQFKIDQL